LEVQSTWITLVGWMAGAVDSGYQAAHKYDLRKGLSVIQELVTVLWDCEAVVIARLLNYKAPDGSDLSPLAPSFSS
jgi:hypothetical protein